MRPRSDCSPTLAQEFRREDDAVAAQFLAHAAGIADGNGRLDDDRRGRIDRHERADHRLDRTGVETIGRGIVIGRRGDDNIVGAFKRFGRVQRCLEVELFFGEETFDFSIDDRRLLVVQHLDLGRHNIIGNNGGVTRQQHGIGQADIAQTGNGNFHNQSHPKKANLPNSFCIAQSPPGAMAAPAQLARRIAFRPPFGVTFDV